MVFRGAGVSPTLSFPFKKSFMSLVSKFINSLGYFKPLFNMWDFTVLLGFLLSFILAVFFYFDDAARKIAVFDNINDRNIVLGQLSIVPKQSNGPNCAKITLTLFAAS